VDRVTVNQRVFADVNGNGVALQGHDSIGFFAAGRQGANAQQRNGYKKD
jgi:hypothetical protein